MNKKSLGIVLICVTLLTCACGKSASQTQTETQASSTNELSEEVVGSGSGQSTEESSINESDYEESFADPASNASSSGEASAVSVTGESGSGESSAVSVTGESGSGESSSVSAAGESGSGESSSVSATGESGSEQSRHSKENPIPAIGDISASSYNEVIENLEKEYGPLHVVTNANGWEEANGLCYLKLVDFTGDGSDELLAVCKKEEEEHYTGNIYSIKDNAVAVIYENSRIEYGMYGSADIIYTAFTSDTGHVFATGREDYDAQDYTFYWFVEGKFKPVYRMKGYLEEGSDHFVNEEETIIVDFWDDDHLGEFMQNCDEITLRAESGAEENTFYEDLLQYSIDDTLNKLGASPSTEIIMSNGSPDDGSTELNHDTSTESSYNASTELIQPYMGDGWHSNSMASDSEGYPVPAYSAEIFDSYIEFDVFDGSSYRKDIHSVERDDGGVMIKLENGQAYYGPDDDPDTLWLYFDWERREDNMSGSDSLFRSKE